jgi:hypothetical protein
MIKIITNTERKAYLAAYIDELGKQFKLKTHEINGTVRIAVSLLSQGISAASAGEMALKMIKTIAGHKAALKFL